MSVDAVPRRNPIFSCKTLNIILQLKRRSHELFDARPGFRISLRCGGRQWASPSTRLASQAIGCRLALARCQLRGRKPSLRSNS
jgi:hypothetical protein